MQTKSKQQLRYYRLCALLILAACCFRTLAVLSKPHPRPRKEDFALVPYSQEQMSLPTEAPSSLDSSLVDIDNRCGAAFHQEELFSLSQSFQITKEPCVLIVHTHGSEAYADSPGYRSTDPDKNVVSVGKEVAAILNAAGIPTIHDTTLHDETLGYDHAYSQAAKSISAYLEEYPRIQMVIDIHRDAIEDAKGRQKALKTKIDGQAVAQLLLVMGTDLSGLPHPNWQSNLSFAMKLQALLQQDHEGLMRQTSLRSSRYNEHFTPFSILLEVGSAGNSQEEALRAGTYFANGLARLLRSMQDQRS